MVQITRALFFFAATSLSFCAPVKRTVDQIKADIASIATQVQTLKTSINAFPATGGTLAAALVSLLRYRCATIPVAHLPVLRASTTRLLP